MTRHSRRRFAGVSFAVTIALVCGCFKSQPQMLALRPLEMKPVGKHLPGGGGAVCFFSEGSLNSHVYMNRGSTKITIRATGHPVATPLVRVLLDGREVGKLDIKNKDPKDYSLVATADSSGNRLSRYPSRTLGGASSGSPLRGELR